MRQILSCRFLFILIALALVFTTPNFCYGQADIPIGTWRIHTSYHAINSIAVSNEMIFGAAGNGVMVVDRSDNSISTYSKLNGLSGSSITCITYDEITSLLLVVYSDGRFDVVDPDNNITGFDPTANAAFTGSKKINDVYVHNSKAYLAADYGVVVFDLGRRQITETWRDLGKQGETLSIIQCTIAEDSIFLATKNGVIAGDLRNNLLDFNNWRRFSEGVFSGPVECIAYFNGAIYAAIDNSGIHSYKNGGWVVKDYLRESLFSAMHASPGKLLIAEANKLWELSVVDELVEIRSPLIEQPRAVFTDQNNGIWIGDGQNGLISNASGNFVNYLANGLSNEKISRLGYDQGVIYALGGGYSESGMALGNIGRVDKLSDGIWSFENSALHDLTDLAIDQNTKKMYRSSFGFGVEEKDTQGTVRTFDESNSPLVNTNSATGFVNVTALENSPEGLWVANYGADKSLHLFKNNDTWESFSFPITASKYPLQLLSDFSGNVWMSLNPALGGGVFVFNRTGNTSAYLTDVVGSGGLPAKAVHSMAVDRDGMVWVGTDQGVGFYINPSEVFSATVDAIKPIFESRFLLKDDKVTAIAVDGGNRKWMGTERGVWLFNSTGEKLIYNFTSQNSPLLSNGIRDIEINDQSGEVFFATDEGLVSFRAGATESNSSFQSVKVFPNPVTSNFAGTVGISGLATDSIIKITDISGKLVWQTQSNGGTATWDVRDYKGQRAATGVYLIFSITQDAGESIVAKIAVVD